ncbi:hypothetical protein SKAU_G00317990 [Synaphobranchus kaupii]|uniref:Uncharacterized protein n=1 Tax=Synaphobranchus kaupii TaxID=118154 RepID=A0A9Q1IM12_SYNKA|nr:hypothetical protein SKAU_G00317990 [Synaphobranchus kaupii]
MKGSVALLPFSQAGQHLPTPQQTGPHSAAGIRGEEGPAWLMASFSSERNSLPLQGFVGVEEERGGLGSRVLRRGSCARKALGPRPPRAPPRAPFHLSLPQAVIALSGDRERAWPSKKGTALRAAWLPELRYVVLPGPFRFPSACRNPVWVFQSALRACVDRDYSMSQNSLQQYVQEEPSATALSGGAVWRGHPGARTPLLAQHGVQVSARGAADGEAKAARACVRARDYSGLALKGQARPSLREVPCGFCVNV